MLAIFDLRDDPVNGIAAAVNRMVKDRSSHLVWQKVALTKIQNALKKRHLKWM